MVLHSLEVGRPRGTIRDPDARVRRTPSRPADGTVPPGRRSRSGANVPQARVTGSVHSEWIGSSSHRDPPGIGYARRVWCPVVRTRLPSVSIRYSEMYCTPPVAGRQEIHARTVRRPERPQNSRVTAPQGTGMSEPFSPPDRQGDT